MKNNDKIKEITVDDTIKYTWKTKNYGIAYFIFCPIYDDGELVKVHIQRLQQTGCEYDRFVLNLEDIDVDIHHFSITSWTHKKKSPEIWKNGYCKDHDTIYSETSVPPHTNTIEFDLFCTDKLLYIRFVED